MIVVITPIQDKRYLSKTIHSHSFIHFFKSESIYKGSLTARPMEYFQELGRAYRGCRSGSKHMVIITIKKIIIKWCVQVDPFKYSKTKLSIVMIILSLTNEILWCYSDTKRLSNLEQHTILWAGFGCKLSAKDNHLMAIFLRNEL